MRANGFDVSSTKSRNAPRTHDCTDSAVAAMSSGIRFARSATSAPNNASVRTHSSMEPSWFPHTPEIL